MSKKQIVYMWVGVAVITLMALFPPWVGGRDSTSESAVGFIGWHFAFKKPHYRVQTPQTTRSYMTNADGEKILTSERIYYPMQSYFNSRIDYGLLPLQIVIALLITVASILSVREKKLQIKTHKE